MLIKIMKMRLDELAGYVSIGSLGFIFGILLTALITYCDGDDPEYTVFRMGTMIALVVNFFIPTIVGMFYMGQLFNCQVSFGMTRKKFIFYDLAVSFLWYLAELLFIGVLYFMEGFYLKAMYSAYPEETMKEIFPGLNLWMFLLMAVILTAVRELLGTLVLRFGNKAFWIIWIVWIAICTLPARIADFIQDGAAENVWKSVTGWAAGISFMGWSVIGAVFIIMALIISWLIVRKQAVAA